VDADDAEERIMKI